MKPTIHRMLLRAFTAQRNRVRPAMSAIGLSPGQPKILDHLAHCERCIQKDLAAVCEIEPATVSKLVDGMESSGLVRREPSPADRRSGCVVITEKGRELQRKAEKEFAVIDSEELAGFTPEEAAAFHSYLSRLYKNLTGKDAE